MKLQNTIMLINFIKQKKYIIVFSICSLTSFIFIFGVFLYSIEVNPIKLNVNLNNKIFTFVPQGWAFFTRNPREAQIILYKVSNNRLDLIPQRHSSIENLYGLNRNASKLMAELQFIKAKLNLNLYKNTVWNYQENKFSEIPREAVMIKNQMEYQLLCGEYIVVFQKTIPWAWSKSMKKLKMPSKIIRLKIVCDNR